VEADRQTNKPNGNGGVVTATATSPATAPAAVMISLSALKEMSISALTKIAKELEIAGATVMRKQELIFEILRVRPRNAPRRLRLPACARLQLSARTRRHLRLAITDT